MKTLAISILAFLFASEAIAETISGGNVLLDGSNWSVTWDGEPNGFRSFEITSETKNSTLVGECYPTKEFRISLITAENHSNLNPVVLIFTNAEGKSLLQTATSHALENGRTLFLSDPDHLRESPRKSRKVVSEMLVSERFSVIIRQGELNSESFAFSNVPLALHYIAQYCNIDLAN